jgi:hypothetical protein
MMMMMMSQVRTHHQGRARRIMLLLLCLVLMIRPTEAFLFTKLLVLLFSSLSNLMGWDDSCPAIPGDIPPPLLLAATDGGGGGVDNDSDLLLCNHEYAPVLCQFRCVYENACEAAIAGYKSGDCFG